MELETLSKFFGVHATLEGTQGFEILNGRVLDTSLVSFDGLELEYLGDGRICQIGRIPIDYVSNNDRNGRKTHYVSGIGNVEVEGIWGVDFPNAAEMYGISALINDGERNYGGYGAGVEIKGHYSDRIRRVGLAKLHEIVNGWREESDMWFISIGGDQMRYDLNEQLISMGAHSTRNIGEKRYCIDGHMVDLSQPLEGMFVERLDKTVS